MSLKEFLEACAARAEDAAKLALAKTGGVGPGIDSLAHQRALRLAKYEILEACAAFDEAPASLRMDASYHREAAWLRSGSRTAAQRESGRLVLTLRGGGSSGVYVYGWFE